MIDPLVFIFGFVSGILFTFAVAMIVWSRLVIWNNMRQTGDWFVEMAKRKRQNEV